ncbi:hypothetical protein [Candidatus Uabimicrobium amorphum]|uniref:Uncharacterized protein n=1 Tax=Uabimicrobium amorphum TaxID=2596890 RepID=A0A5S9IPB1_UABAM|nr:hypothetical protein [Candidatus Uabimicrobium amorphum]BBM85197.1 hypothetical protein UABAM_03560 [Candidatus Uabimicrobium amorphum]
MKILHGLLRFVLESISGLTLWIAISFGLMLVALTFIGAFALALGNVGRKEIELYLWGLGILVVALGTCFASRSLSKKIPTYEKEEDTTGEEKYLIVCKVRYKKASKLLIFSAALIAVLSGAAILYTWNLVISIFFLLSMYVIRVATREDREIGSFIGQRVGVDIKGITHIEDDIFITWSDMELEDLSAKKCMRFYSKSDSEKEIFVSLYAENFPRLMDMFKERVVKTNVQEVLYRDDLQNSEDFDSYILPELPQKYRGSWDRVFIYLGIVLIFFAVSIFQIREQDYTGIIVLGIAILMMWAMFFIEIAITVQEKGIIVHHVFAPKRIVEWKEIGDISIQSENNEGDISLVITIKLKDNTVISFSHFPNSLEIYKQMKCIHEAHNPNKTDSTDQPTL